jgi:hypothetical protein
LNQHQIKHVFFNGNNNFESISYRYDWGVNYLDPYNPQMTYDRILKNNKYRPLKANSYHYGKEAHSFFAQYMLQYITDNKILESSK